MKLQVKCLCGINKIYETQEEQDRLPWNDDETLSCECGKRLRFKGHNGVKLAGYAFVEIQGKQ